jgi:hypothetical protein
MGKHKQDDELTARQPSIPYLDAPLLTILSFCYRRVVAQSASCTPKKINTERHRLGDRGEIDHLSWRTGHS